MKAFTNSYCRTALLTSLVVINILLTSCANHCTVTTDYVYFEPVYTSYDDLRAAVKAEDPKALAHPGKIYFKDNFLYILETAKGIHVIDNADPSHPIPVSFINVPGSFDIAIRGATLYADSYTDLVAIDVSVPTQEKEVGRYNNLFSSFSSISYNADPVLGVITEWKEVGHQTISEDECDINLQPGGWRLFGGGLLMREDYYYAAVSSATPGGNVTTGVGGSMARFAVHEQYLYALDAANMNVVDVSNSSALEPKSKINIAWDIETIFPHGENLFIGSRSGMHIFSITSPDNPVKISTYDHIRSCDPVVVEGKYAYVTLRDGSACGGFTNQLEVIDLTTLSAPSLVKVYPMTHPHGLGIDNGTLFICEGDGGLKVFDATDVTAIADHPLAHYKDIHAFDIIPLGHVAMVIGADGLFQYDYSDVNNIQLLSHMPVNPAE